MRVALDTNVLAYAEGVNTPAQQRQAKALLGRVPRAAIALPVQVLGELFHVLVRKAKFAPHDAHTVIKAWHQSVSLLATSPEALENAIDMVRDHRLSIWDAVIVSAAAEGRCRLLLSGDMHEGFTWGGVTVTNPFASQRHALLESLLESGRTR